LDVIQYLSQSHWSLFTKRGKRKLDHSLRFEIDEMQLAEPRSSDLPKSFVNLMSLSGFEHEVNRLKKLNRFFGVRVNTFSRFWE